MTAFAGTPFTESACSLPNKHRRVIICDKNINGLQKSVSGIVDVCVSHLLSSRSHLIGETGMRSKCV